MRHSVVAFAALTFSSLISAQAPNASDTTYLTAPALVTTPENTTTIQCWRLKYPFTVSTTAGTAGSRAIALGNVTSLGYVIQPPRFDGGLHNAPTTQ
jgi:xanthine/uracil permease